MDELIQNREHPTTDSFPVTTMAGETVRIVEKVADPQRGTVLIAEDGGQYVSDPTTGFAMKLEDAPLDETAEQAPANAGAPEEDDTPPAEPTTDEPTEDDTPPAEPTDEPPAE